MDEIWKPVKGYPYEVSDLGRVRRTSAACGTHIGRLLKPQVSRYGYLRITLTEGKANIRTMVHRLVASAFIGPCPEGFQTNHKNGVKADNCAENLEYITASDNILHAYRTGLKSAAGSKNGQSKLTNRQILEIRQKYATKKFLQRELADEYEVSRPSISLIVNRKIWTHI